MSVELQDALAQLAHSVHDDGAPDRMTGQVRHMVTKIRRRRAVRQVTTGAVSAGAVAVVAVVGLQLADRDGTVRPSADTLEGSGFTACGSTPSDPNPGASWAVSLVIEPVEAGTGAVAGPALDPAGAVVSVSFAGAVEGIFEVVGEPQLALTRGGVVVSPPAELEGTSDAMPPVFSLRQAPVSCDTATSGARLPNGDYELVALQTVDFGTGVPVQLFARTSLVIAGGSTADSAPATGNPTAQDATAAAEAARDREAAQAMLEAHLAAPSSDPFPACRSAVLSRSGDVLALDLALEDRPYARGEHVDGEVAVRTVDGRAVIGQAPTSGARLVLTRGGTVVGSTYSDPEDVDLLDLGPQDAAIVPLYGAMSLCAEPLTDAAQPGLPPGTYTAYAVMDVMLQEVTGANGVASSRSDLTLAVSGPVDVTVE